MNAGKLIIETVLDTDEVDNGLSLMKKMFEQALSTEPSEEMKKSLQEVIDLLNQIDNKGTSNPDYFDSSEYLTDLYQLDQLIDKIDTNKIPTQVQEISNQIKGINTGLTRTIKNVGRWALSLFGITTIFGAIRSAMSTITQYDKQLGADIQYIKNALAFALEPIVRGIVNLIKQLLYYVAYIIKAWTGKNIFENANKSLQSATGSAKELKKQLAGFDEMEILSDNSSGGGGAAAPSMDLTNLEGEVPGWIEWIANNGDIVQSILYGIATALVALKLGLTPLQALGVGIFAGGFLFAIKSLLEYIKDPSWINFGKIIEGIGIAIMGLGIAFASVTTAVTGGAILLLGIVIKYWEQIKTILQNGIDWLSGKSEWIHEHLGDIIGGIYDFIVSTLQNILNWFDSTFTNIKKIFDGIITFIKGVFTGNWKQAWEGIKQIFIGVWNIIKSTFVTVFNFIKGLVITVGSTVGNIIAGAFKAVVNGVLSAIEKILNVPIKTINGLIKVINKVPGINISKLSTFSLPRLARGGIVNNPGPGVMMGSYVAGENGPEAILPLTDDTLQRLANMMPITVHVTNTMNGRIISREIQKVQNSSDFAYNR